MLILPQEELALLLARKRAAIELAALVAAFLANGAQLRLQVVAIAERGSASGRGWQPWDV